MGLGTSAGTTLALGFMFPTMPLNHRPQRPIQHEAAIPPVQEGMEVRSLAARVPFTLGCMPAALSFEADWGHGSGQ